MTRTQGANQALKDGTVDSRTVSFDFVEVSPLIRAFRRMVRELEFDVCELAITTYLCARAHGKPITALPIFLVRGMHHGAIVHNTKAGVRTPRDLEGSRVGVNRGYTVTTGVWARGILAEEYGVDLEKITWVLSGDEHVAEYRPPPNVVPADANRDMSEMVASGELPAAVGISADHPDVAPLIPGPDEAGIDALRRRGFYPINHLVVVRDELLDEHPGVAAEIFRVFAAAKEQYIDRLRSGDITSPTAADRLHEQVMRLGFDPLPYGVEPNRPMLDKLMDYAIRQRVLDKPLPLEALFHEDTLDLQA